MNLIPRLEKLVLDEEREQQNAILGKFRDRLAILIAKELAKEGCEVRPGEIMIIQRGSGVIEVSAPVSFDEILRKEK